MLKSNLVDAMFGVAKCGLFRLQPPIEVGEVSCRCASIAGRHNKTVLLSYLSYGQPLMHMLPRHLTLVSEVQGMDHHQLRLLFVSMANYKRPAMLLDSS